MSIQLSESQKQILLDKSFVHLATVNADGSPQVSPVWVDFDGQNLIVNSEQRRLKVRNMKRDPRVSLSVTDPQNPYRYMEIRGRVLEISVDQDGTVIDKLAKKYLGQDKYPFNQPGDVRLTFKIEPLKVAGINIDGPPSR